MTIGLKGFQKGNKIALGKAVSAETRMKISVALTGNKNCLGRTASPEQRIKMSLAQIGNKKGLGHKKTEEYKRYWSEKRKGKNGSNWKGGLTPFYRTVRNSVDTNLWRIKVFIRDNRVCQKCFIKTRHLNAHHIQNFSQYPELRFVLSNGITFCKKCHDEFHKKYGRRNNNYEQIKEYLQK